MIEARHWWITLLLWFRTMLCIFGVWSSQIYNGMVGTVRVGCIHFQIKIADSICVLKTSAAIFVFKNTRMFFPFRNIQSFVVFSSSSFQMLLVFCVPYYKHYWGFLHLSLRKHTFQSPISLQVLQLPRESTFTAFKFSFSSEHSKLVAFCKAQL